jgi:transcriptional regulator with XRE-family HTH domain
VGRFSAWIAPMTNDEKQFFQRLGLRIAQLRKERGLTQTELASTLGLTQQRVASFEKGRRRLAVSQLVPLSRALAVSVEDLLGEQSPARKRGPMPRLLLQVERIRELPKAKQRFVMEMLDTVLRQAS